MNNKLARIEYRRNLPHIQPQDAMFFITFRLYGSIPLAKLDYLKTTYQNTKVTDISGIPVKQLKESQQEDYFRALDDMLDENPNGPYYLANREIAKLVFDSIMFRDGKDYKLVCFCIMSNHVHLIIYKLTKPLDIILKELKSFTGKEAMKILRGMESEALASFNYSSEQALRVPVVPDSEAPASFISKTISQQAQRVSSNQTKFWQPESFDRIIRDRNEMTRRIKYTINNPVKAGIVDGWSKWEWNYCRPEFLD